MVMFSFGNLKKSSLVLIKFLLWLLIIPWYKEGELIKVSTVLNKQNIQKYYYQMQE